MTTLRVRLDGPIHPERADAWALYGSGGTILRSGSDRPVAWPDADAVELVLSARQLRIVTVTLPPMHPSRVAAAAGFAVEDQLAGPAAIHHLAVSPQASDGTVRVVIVAKDLVAGVGAHPRGIARIVAEPDLASALPGWRWCASDDDGGFVRCADGSAFAVEVPRAGGRLPAALALALARAARDGNAPAQVRVNARCDDAALAGWQAEAGCAFVRGAPWRWQDAPAVAFASALNLIRGTPDSGTNTERQRPARLFATAAMVAGVALALHVVASLGEWATLRVAAWREAREWTALAAVAGLSADAAATPPSARMALARRYADLRHAQGLPAPDDAMPLLARAAPALATLPPGSVKSALYADGHWTLELARATPAALHDLERALRAARTPAIVATAASGTRVRIGGP